MNQDLPSRLTLPRLADMLGRSTSALRDLRNRDPRFPRCDKRDRHSLRGVVCLLHLRELEKMTDTQYRDHAYGTRRRLVAECDGGSLAGLPDDAKARLLACPLPTHEEAIGEALADFESL